MPSVTIKNITEDVLDRLRERARIHRRSLQGELVVILEEAVKPKKLTLREVHEEIKKLGLKTDDDSVAIIRELRDSR